MIFRRRQTVDFWKREYDELARYNTQVSQGLVHDPAFVERMKAVQRDYAENIQVYRKRKGA